MNYYFTIIFCVLVESFIVIVSFLSTSANSALNVSSSIRRNANCSFINDVLQN